MAARKRSTDREATEATEAAVPRKPRGRPVTTGPTKERASFYLNPDVLERARNAVYWASPRVTLNELAEKGLDRAVAELEKKNGGPFAKRERDL